MDISVVIPVYGCRTALPVLCERLNDTLSSIAKEYEIILVDDHCPQNSWDSIKELCEKDKHIKGIHLSRNFGQANAITAGIDICMGDWVVVMDCDLQDPPEAIVDLYNKAQEGYDVVFARRASRKDSVVTKFLSKSFYKVYSYLADTKVDPSINNFSIASRSVIDYYRRIREHSRAYTLFIRWLGFRQTAIDIEAEERYEGRSSYNLRKKLKFAGALITSHSNKPLYLMIKLGLFVAFVSFVFIFILVIQKFLGYDYLTGWTSVIASVYLMSGILLTAVGMVGVYIGNIYEEAKNRPLYVVAEMLNFQEKE
jgi:dolichol-phosphate mannosyltransferase